MHESSATPHLTDPELVKESIEEKERERKKRGRGSVSGRKREIARETGDKLSSFDIGRLHV
jgi:hypothetical protein